MSLDSLAGRSSALEPMETLYSTARRRGRPWNLPPTMVLERIVRLARRCKGLFRVHRTHRTLYARARRQFGSWAEAVRAAGLDYELVIRRAQKRSIETRRRRSAIGRRSRRPNP